MQTPHTKRPSLGSQGFTLVEMLTVIGIIALLVALVTPALVDVIRATRLGSAGDSLFNRLSLAQQSAISQNTEVELRFYQYINVDSDNPGEAAFYAYQVVSTPPGADPQAISEVYYLESGVVISQLAKLSPLLGTVVQQHGDSKGNYIFKPAVSGVLPNQVRYAALRFYTDGSCRKLSESDVVTTAEQAAIAYTIPPLKYSFLTLIESRDALSQDPRNFYCIQVDTYTGKTRVYRP